MNNTITTSGKRKSSKASAVIKSGSGNIKINKIPIVRLPMLRRLAIEEPMRIAQETLGNTDFDIALTVRGGGKESRIEAARLALARAIVKFSKSENLKKAYALYDKSLLVADVRRKEAYKPGDSKARSRRQKSYR
jgi:small subunit ribosomal protein S9